MRQTDRRSIKRSKPPVPFHLTMSRILALKRSVAPLLSQGRSLQTTLQGKLAWCGPGAQLSRTPSASLFTWGRQAGGQPDREQPSPHVDFFVVDEAPELSGEPSGGGGQEEGWSEHKASRSEAVVRLLLSVCSSMQSELLQLQAVKTAQQEKLQVYRAVLLQRAGRS